MEGKRSSFSGSLGFVLAAAGSAVGLGNIWRFPYLAAKYGGGIFLLVYIILALTLGFTIMTAEIAIGRKTGLSAIGAYTKLDKRFSFLSWISALVPIIILPYYSVIGGWVTKYIGVYVMGEHTEAAGNSFFGEFISSPVEPLIWFMIFLTVTFVIVLLGVEGGVERVSKYMMPVLVLLSIIVAVYSITRPGAMEGVKYYLIPDFSKFSVKTVLAALGQMFYSMSLAMGIMITYGSYMKKEVDITKAVGNIEIFDTCIAFIAGLMIIPAVFAFSGGDPEALNKGPGLMFETIPKVFEEMGMSTLIGAVFFILVFFAALTSSISLMETVVSIVVDKAKIKRRWACVIVYAGSLLMGVPSSLGFGLWSDFKIGSMTILDMFDFLSNSVIMPVVAFLTCIFVAYVIGTKAISEEIKLSSKFKREKLFNVIIKYVAPVCIVLILVSSILEGVGVLKI